MHEVNTEQSRPTYQPRKERSQRSSTNRKILGKVITAVFALFSIYQIWMIVLVVYNYTRTNRFCYIFIRLSAKFPVLFAKCPPRLISLLKRSLSWNTLLESINPRSTGLYRQLSRFSTLSFCINWSKLHLECIENWVKKLQVSRFLISSLL